MNMQIQAKTRKSKNRTIKSKFENVAATINYTSWVVYRYPTANPIWLTAAILKIAMTS